MNQASENRLAKVNPVLATRVRVLIVIVPQYAFEVVQGLRTYGEQDGLFAQGRTRPGEIVTRARGGHSNHNFGLAVDLCPVRNGTLDWKWREAFLALNAAADTVGLAWGGDWAKLVDMPHLELAGLSVDECRALYERNHNLADVWESPKLPQA